MTKRGGIMAQFNENSMGAIFQNRAQQYGDKTLVIYKSKSGKWEEISWNKLNEMVRDLSMFLIKRGVQPGDKGFTQPTLIGVKNVGFFKV
jgi:long-subunit acyl-CoA synthetase (AMP-forming)